MIPLALPSTTPASNAGRYLPQTPTKSQHWFWNRVEPLEQQLKIIVEKKSSAGNARIVQVLSRHYRVEMMPVNPSPIFKVVPGACHELLVFQITHAVFNTAPALSRAGGADQNMEGLGTYAA